MSNSVYSVNLFLGNAALLTRAIITDLEPGGRDYRRRTGEGDIGHGECLKEFVLA
jgi:hypothetical protein